jgi:hypothetical protein
LRNHETSITGFEPNGGTDLRIGGITNYGLHNSGFHVRDKDGTFHRRHGTVGITGESIKYRLNICPGGADVKEHAHHKADDKDDDPQDADYFCGRLHKKYSTPADLCFLSS